MRPFRRILAVVIVLVSLAALYLGAGFPSDVLGGLFLGFAVAALVRVAFGAPGGKPSVAEVGTALADMGYEVTSITPADERIARAAVMDVVLDNGDHLRVDAFGRDQRDACLAAKVWHKAMYHDPGLPVFGSRVQQVEHIGFALMLAERAEVRAARLVATGVGGADAAVLVTTPPAGKPIGALPTDEVSDAVLADAWQQLDRLHHAGIAHGNLDMLRVVVDDGSVAFDDFSSADATGEQYWYDRDDAALLVMSAQLVGDERAIAAAVDALGKERMASVIPVVQPAALPDALTRGVKHQGKALKQLRTELATATGAEDVPPLKIKRLSLVNIGMLAGILLRPRDRDPQPRGHQLVVGPEPVRERHLGLGAARVPALPTRADGVGHCAARLCEQGPAVRPYRADPARVHVPEPDHTERDRRHRPPARLPAQAGRPRGVGGSAMVLSTGVGGAIQMALFLIAAAHHRDRGRHQQQQRLLRQHHA